MIKVIRIMPDLAGTGLLSELHCKRTGFKYFSNGFFSAEVDHRAIIAHLGIMEGIGISMGYRHSVSIRRSSSDQFELDIHIYLSMNDPFAIFVQIEPIIAAVLIKAFDLRLWEGLAIELDDLSRQDTGVVGNFLPIDLGPVILYEAIIRRLFYHILIIENSIRESINP
jgi:hypothetical protein